MLLELDLTFANDDGDADEMAEMALPASSSSFSSPEFTLQPESRSFSPSSTSSSSSSARVSCSKTSSEIPCRSKEKKFKNHIDWFDKVEEKNSRTPPPTHHSLPIPFPNSYHALRQALVYLHRVGQNIRACQRRSPRRQRAQLRVAAVVVNLQTNKKDTNDAR